MEITPTLTVHAAGAEASSRPVLEAQLVDGLVKEFGSPRAVEEAFNDWLAASIQVDELPASQWPGPCAVAIGRWKASLKRAGLATSAEIFDFETAAGATE